MLFWLARLGLRRAAGHAGPAVHTVSIQGFRLTLDWAAAEHVAVREILGRGEYWPTREFRPSRGDVVVDVGANAGVFTTIAASWVGPSGRVIAIEPNVVVASRLERNITQNHFDDRTTIIRAGTSNHVGVGTLYVGSNSTTSSVSPMRNESRSSVPIELETLDHLVADMGIDTIDHLKIDVEGLEVATLDGGTSALARCQKLVLEVSDAADVPTVVGRCRAAGFDEVSERLAGADSGATLVFARRVGAVRSAG